jgi:hypothetical protein
VSDAGSDNDDDSQPSSESVDRDGRTPEEVRDNSVVEDAGGSDTDGEQSSSDVEQAATASAAEPDVEESETRPSTRREPSVTGQDLPPQPGPRRSMRERRQPEWLSMAQRT